jgi:hypothetical protein
VQLGVGDGKAIKMMSDNWIPDRPPYMVNPLKPILNHATVSCLFDEETREWIPEMINAFFLSRNGIQDSTSTNLSAWRGGFCALTV